MKPLRWMAAVLLIAGGSLLARSAYLVAKAQLAGVLVQRVWAQSVQTGKPEPPWPWADTHPIARLQIPRLGLDEFVLEDASPRNLAFGPAGLLSGAHPGAPGNLIIAGHRTSWFRPLEHIQRGDRVELQWFEPGHAGLRQQTYSVESISITGPADTSLLAPEENDVLTLITCYPFGHRPDSPQRFIVRAAPIAQQVASKSPQ